MKNTCLFLFLLISISAYSQPTTKLITYNIRYANKHDGDDNWDNRKAKVVDIIKTNNPDIVGLQEVLKKQLTYLDKNLDQYNHVGVGRDDGKTQGEYSPIFYKKDKYSLVDKGWFWVSETPNKPSKGWDAACKRICTWVLLADKEKKPVLVFNTHLDHKGEEARSNGAKLIMDSLKAKAGTIANVFFMGDFNATPGSVPYAKLSDNKVLGTSALTDSYIIATAKAGTVGTTNSFKTELTEDQIKTRIDYIFLNPKIYKTINYAVLLDKVNGRWPSDHMPVMVEVE